MNVKIQKMSIKFKCPCCGQKLIAGEDWGGTRVLCPYCNNFVTVSKKKMNALLALLTDNVVFSVIVFGGLLLSLIFSIILSERARSSSQNTTQSPSHITTQSVEQNTTQSVNQSVTQTTTQSAKSISSSRTNSTWMDDSDPIKWRKEEEQLERGSGLSNAKYACRRCGMKSHYSLDDGVNGLGGVCMYCLNYMVERKKQGLPIR